MKYSSNPLSHAIFLALLLLISDVASAQDHTRLLCSDCRDPNIHPSDFGNFAFNTLKSPNNGFTFDELDEVEVINQLGQWAWVNMAFEMVVIDIGFKIPTFLIPTGNIVIEVTDPYARLTTYLVDLEIPNLLSIGSGTGPGYNPGGGSDASEPEDGGDSEDDMDSRDYQDYEDHYEDYWDTWDAWEGGYGGQTRSCYGDFTDPNDTIVVCSR